MCTEGMDGKLLQQNVCNPLHAEFVVRVTDVENLTVAGVILVFNDPEQAVDAVLDIGEATFLAATVHQVDNKLGDYPGTADSCRF